MTPLARSLMPRARPAKGLLKTGSQARRGGKSLAIQLRPSSSSIKLVKRARSMREVGAFEAKNKLGQLLDLVEQGEEIIITRHGRAVARLTPVRLTHNREQARAALRRLRQRAETRKLGRFDWAEWQADRRRPSVTPVLDRSATLAWICGDEATEPLRRRFDAIADPGAVAPASWRLEGANSLTTALRRGRLDAAFRHAGLADLAVLDLRVDPDAERHAWGATLEVADRFRLTADDAADVELASRRKIPLAAWDAHMRAAGEALGLQMLERA